MVTRKPVPSRPVSQGWQASNDGPYAASPPSRQAPTPQPGGSTSPSTSPTFYEMKDPWADEAVERQEALDPSGNVPTLADGRQDSEYTRVQEGNIPPSLRIGPSGANQQRAEEHQRFKSSRLHGRRPTTADADKKQQNTEGAGLGTNPFHGIARGTNPWQGNGNEEESLANIWRDMATTPVAPSGAPPPPPLAENKTGVLISIRAFVDAEVVPLS